MTGVESWCDIADTTLMAFIDRSMRLLCTWVVIALDYKRQLVTYVLLHSLANSGGGESQGHFTLSTSAVLLPMARSHAVLEAFKEQSGTGRLHIPSLLAHPSTQFSYCVQIIGPRLQPIYSV